MPPDGARVFGDLLGKLDHLVVTCDKCGRRGRYRVDRLIEAHGRDATVPNWLTELTADCPRRQRGSYADPCAALCPGLREVF